MRREIVDLQQRLAALVQKQSDLDADKEPTCVSWTPYEAFIGDNPLEFMRLGKDAVETTLDWIKKQPLTHLKGCIRFFEGDNLITKKAKLIKFLKRAPTYKTKNLKLLEQRLYITRKWTRENNFTGPLEDLPLEVPVSAPPSP